MNATIESPKTILDDTEISWLLIEAIEESDDVWHRFQQKIDETESEILAQARRKELGMRIRSTANN